LNFHEHFIGKHWEKVNVQKFRYIAILRVHFKCIKLGPSKMYFTAFENSTRKLIKLYRQFGFPFRFLIPFACAFEYDIYIFRTKQFFNEIFNLKRTWSKAKRQLIPKKL